ncbi:MAG: NADPH-dependent oxidoreductase [Xanthobacteraceae bacterium]|nr:MAG: NADPH-dependent oxidoreductase [Xanthobacteraceae bacterium]
MAALKILVIPGSVRTGSHNVRLAASITRELALGSFEVTRISLQDYPLPIYDADHEVGSGTPRHALQLRQLIASHHGIVLVSPEYNASIPPLLKNALDWASSTTVAGDAALAAFRGRAFALASASPGKFGGARALTALRQTLELGCGALVIPRQLSVTFADKAFDDADHLSNARDLTQMRHMLRDLVDVAQRMAG